MKIVFVGIAVESLAIEFLSSYLKERGHDVHLVFDPNSFSTEVINQPLLAKFFDTKNPIVNQIKKINPDLIGFSVFTLNYQRSLTLSRLIKSQLPDIPIIFGGIHPTSVPEIVIKEPSVDMVCIGEGEEALDELLQNPEKTGIKNIWFKKNNKIIKNPCRPLIKNLDTLPFPDKDLYWKIYKGFFRDYYTISSRGCPFACTYCANNVIRRIYQGLGPPIRRRSPENIVEELSLAKKKYHLKLVTFVDDVFVQDLGWLKEFAKLYKKNVNLPYAMLTHPKFINKEIAKTLVKSGCYFLLFGIQSASEKIRTSVLERFETNAEIENAAKSCHQAGLRFSIDHIFNIPGETVTEYVQAMRFYNKLRPSVINAYWLQYFPKTKIIDHALKLGILTREDVLKIENGQASSSLVLGFGNKDSVNPNQIYSHIQLFFMILPFLSQNITNKIINTRFYLKPVKIPMIIAVSIKFLLIFINKRAEVYIGIIRSIIYFSFYSLWSKLVYGKSQT